jgi:hypothetical protein
MKYIIIILLMLMFSYTCAQKVDCRFKNNNITLKYNFKYSSFDLTTSDGAQAIKGSVKQATGQQYIEFAGSGGFFFIRYKHRILIKNKHK